MNCTYTRKVVCGEQRSLGNLPQESDPRQKVGNQAPALYAACWHCSLVAKLCLTLCEPMNCSPPGSSAHEILQVSILEWVSHSVLQGIFLAQGLNPHLLLFRQILYHLSHQGSCLCSTEASNSLT